MTRPGREAEWRAAFDTGTWRVPTARQSWRQSWRQGWRWACHELTLTLLALLAAGGWSALGALGTGTTDAGARLHVRDASGRPRALRAGDALAPRWRVEQPGLERAELALSVEQPDGVGVETALPRVPLRVVLVRLDPARLALRLHARPRDDGAAGPWTIADAPADAALAVNAGQFDDAGPWGWVVHRGRELQPPGAGALAGALTVDARGRARILDAAELPAARRRGDVVEAVQSYPTLLAGDGAVPAALRAGTARIDRAHRDARLAACELRDGRLLLALTRLDAPGAGAVPLGLTVPETATLAAALGCRRALLLDGGVSAQLLVRDARGAATAWRGLRAVPLGLVAAPAATGAAPGSRAPASAAR